MALRYSRTVRGWSIAIRYNVIVLLGVTLDAEVEGFSLIQPGC